jgi:hypothetical protein
MKRRLAIVMLGFLGLVTAVRASAQLEGFPRGATQKREQSSAPRGPLDLHPMYQRGDTWYEFLLKQLNPNNFDYGG